MQKKNVKNHCTTGVQRMGVRWGSNWGEGEPHGEKKVQVVMQRTEGWGKWEEKKDIPSPKAKDSGCGWAQLNATSPETAVENPSESSRLRKEETNVPFHQAGDEFTLRGQGFIPLGTARGARADSGGLQRVHPILGPRSRKRIPGYQVQARTMKESPRVTFRSSPLIRWEGNEAIISAPSCIVLKSSGKLRARFTWKRQRKSTLFQVWRPKVKTFLQLLKEMSSLIRRETVLQLMTDRPSIKPLVQAY